MKERKSFRFSLDTFQKLDTLQELEKQQAEKFNITPKSITAIVEDAIAEYYVLKLDKDTGTDYLSRCSETTKPPKRYDPQSYPPLCHDVL